jgi:hypothetical protein
VREVVVSHRATTWICTYLVASVIAGLILFLT